MIKARAVVRDGYFSLEICGHGEASVCAGASATMFAAALGLREMAGRYPKEISFWDDSQYDQDGKERTKL